MSAPLTSTVTTTVCGPRGLDAAGGLPVSQVMVEASRCTALLHGTPPITTLMGTTSAAGVCCRTLSPPDISALHGGYRMSFLPLGAAAGDGDTGRIGLRLLPVMVTSVPPSVDPLIGVMAVMTGVRSGEYV